ncbi:MAG TPA: metallophosphoesterase [Pseudonocardia sp.]|nr:metallophosphoesterase [Pseudonocardia sp.]
MSFLLAAVVVVVVVHLFLYRRLVHDLRPGRRARRLGATAVAVLMASSLAAFGLQRVLDPTGPADRVLAYVGYTWLVLALYLSLVLVVVELPRALLRRRMDPGRRVALARLLGGVAGVLALGTVGYGLAAARSPRLVRREVTLDRLDPALDGVTISVLSDIHLGPINGRPFLDDVVAAVNAENPDLVAIVGDLVDGSVADLGPAASALAGLGAPAYFVTGNHEYFSGAQQWCEFLPSLGVRVLRNERVAVGRRGAAPGSPTFDLAGIDDRTAARSHLPGHGANLDAALAGRDPSRAVVLLAHQPVLVDQAARRDVDLQISGHTHGGQFLPLGYVVLLDQPVLAGLTRVGRTWLYVTRGVGFWGPPVRVGAPPEITVLTLRASRRA